MRGRQGSGGYIASPERGDDDGAQAPGGVFGPSRAALVVSEDIREKGIRWLEWMNC
jgi:hypothetical protein